MFKESIHLLGPGMCVCGWMGVEYWDTEVQGVHLVLVNCLKVVFSCLCLRGFHLLGPGVDGGWGRIIGGRGFVIYENSLGGLSTSKNAWLWRGWGFGNNLRKVLYFWLKPEDFLILICQLKPNHGTIQLRQVHSNGNVFVFAEEISFSCVCVWTESLSVKGSKLW